MPYIYILHFRQPIAHARHYSGCTKTIVKRLIKHAFGHGSRLTRECYETGINWTLGALAETTISRMRKIERQLKDSHNQPDYCELCRPGAAKKITGTQPYPPLMINFPIDSDVIRAKLAQDDPIASHSIIVRPTDETDMESANPALLHLMRRDKDALGFIPCGGDGGLAVLIKSGRIIVAEHDKRIIGYAAFTVGNNTINIHQACVTDEFRLEGVGRRIVQAVHERYGYELPLKCCVRDDLPANAFWAALGFTRLDQFRHKTSRSTINTYTKEVALWQHTKQATDEPTKSAKTESDSVSLISSPGSQQKHDTSTEPQLPPF